LILKIVKYVFLVVEYGQTGLNTETGTSTKIVASANSAYEVVADSYDGPRTAD
jgi:hypothetical protein